MLLWQLRQIFCGDVCGSKSALTQGRHFDLHGLNGLALRRKLVSLCKRLGGWWCFGDNLCRKEAQCESNNRDGHKRESKPLSCIHLNLHFFKVSLAHYPLH